jgi:hypothetical protein
MSEKMIVIKASKTISPFLAASGTKKMPNVGAYFSSRAGSLTLESNMEQKGIFFASKSIPVPQCIFRTNMSKICKSYSAVPHNLIPAS